LPHLCYIFHKELVKAFLSYFGFHSHIRLAAGFSRPQITNDNMEEGGKDIGL
jgi:hypothetical protein